MMDFHTKAFCADHASNSALIGMRVILLAVAAGTILYSLAQLV